MRITMIGHSTVLIESEGVKWRTRLKGAKNVTGIKAWQSQHFGPVTVTAVPAVHLAVTVGFVVQSEGKQAYFAGDTYYRPFMEEIGQRFQLDVALMPVTTYRIPMTMGERGAVRAVQALKPTTVIPIHLAVAPRSPLLRTNHTPEGFTRRLREAGSKTEVVVLQEGETWAF
ncbi:MAG: MBL fold metallo-hydrolase [Anaerolineae bacterium]